MAIDIEVRNQLQSGQTKTGGWLLIKSLLNLEVLPTSFSYKSIK
jgi:hypothetical protein